MIQWWFRGKVSILKGMGGYVCVVEGGEVERRGAVDARNTSGR